MIDFHAGANRGQGGSGKNGFGLLIGLALRCFNAASSNVCCVERANRLDAPHAPRSGAVTSGQIHTTALADVAGGRGNNPSVSHRFDGTVLSGFGPCLKWSIWSFDETDSEGGVTPAYFARSQARDVLLAVSRFNFKPTQERFDWLVQNGFPPFHISEETGVHCPWTDASIDAAIAQVRAAA